MVGQAAAPASPLATVFLVAVVAAGFVLGLVRGRGGEVSDTAGWSERDASHGDGENGSCDGH